MPAEQLYLSGIDNPPQTPAAGDYNLQWATKIFEQTNPQLLETAINNWLLTEPVTTGIPRYLGAPVYLGERGGKMSVLIPYAYFVAPALT